MGVFGNLWFSNGTVFHTKTDTDTLMNNACGGILVFTVLTGLAVNMYLIYYYRKHLDRSVQGSWTDRYYWWLSIAQLLYTVCRGVPTTYFLLNKLPPDINHTWYDKVVTSIDYVSGAAMTTIVAVIVVVQYSNIHRSRYILLNGQSGLRKKGSVGIMVVCVAWFALSIILQFTVKEHWFVWMRQNEFYCFDTSGAVLQSLYLLPLFTIVAVSSCLYILTIVRFRLNQEYQMFEEIRREFRVVGALIGVTVIWLISNIAQTVYTFKGTRIEYKDFYFIFVASVMVPVAESTVNALIIFFSEPGIREKFSEPGIREKWRCLRSGGDGYQVI